MIRKIAIMQPYMFPYIGYWQLMNEVDLFVIYDDVNFIKRGWINRNNILENGEASLFSMPLSGASQNKKINEITFFELRKWSHKFLNQLKKSYAKAPYFKEIEELLQEIFNENYTESTSIVDLFIKHVDLIAQYLEIDIDLSTSSKAFNNSMWKGQSRIIDICSLVSAQKYINPIGGKELYTTEAFEEENIELSFMQSKPFEYKQFDNEFVPWLSIIDVLMFNSKEQVIDLINSYELIWRKE